MILGEFVGSANNRHSHLPRTTKLRSVAGRLKVMLEVTLGQKWIMADATFGTFFAEATEVFEGGISGILIITDEQGNIVDTFTGSAAEFQASGEWRLFEE